MSNGRADDCVLVIFGASGDLTHRKLLPALFNLAETGHLPERLAVVGVARTPLSDEAFREDMRSRVRHAEEEPLDEATWRRLGDALHYVAGDFGNPELYQALGARLQAIAAERQIPPNYLFYFAIPPQLFGQVAKQLAAAGLTREDEGWRRVVVEKPFGYDLASARALNAELSEGLRETQIYRINHYLGKETVQNILAFRFANGIFEPIWNRRYVDHVRMTVAEEVGVEGRGAYYETAGALRDIVQNHMFQVLTLVAMEPPISFEAEAVRDEKVKVLHAAMSLSTDDVRRSVVRAQYTAAGERRGYREEPKVDPQSSTETYVAMRLFLDNWRWAGVPFYLRTGKRMAERRTEVVVEFKRAPFTLFRDTPVACTNPNALTIRIQPDEGISLAFDAKAPGPLSRLETVTMNFGYREYFKSESNTGYETLLFDAMSGDQTLFHRMDMVEAGWQVVEPVLTAWRDDRSLRMAQYPAGSWGPADADVLLERDGRRWRC